MRPKAPDTPVVSRPPSAAARVNAPAAVPASPVVLVMPPPAPATTPEHRAEYDEYARLVEATKAPNARKEVLRIRILASYAHLAPGEKTIARGDVYDLDIGMQGTERKVIGLMKLCRYLTPKRFFAACSMTLAAFEANVTEPDRAEFVTEARTGGRRITPTKRFKDAA